MLKQSREDYYKPITSQRVDFLDEGLPERFWAKVERKENGCWHWTASKVNEYGHGAYYFGGEDKKQWLAHRAAFHVFVGPLPEVIHHTCNNSSCVNPEHLLALTHDEHVYVGDGPSAKNTRKTHCPRGHEYSEDNTSYEKTDRRENAARRCITCAKKRRRLRYLRTMENRNASQEIEFQTLQQWLEDTEPN